MANALNIEMSLLKAFGIIAVVISHHLNPSPAFFPANSYHIALFLFASGYFYSYGNEENPARYILKRAKWFAAVFYLYHLFHALELYMMWQVGIPMGGGAPEFPQLLYYPFLTFSSYGLGFAMWFVIQLFFAQFLLLALRILLRALEAHEVVITLIFLLMALAAANLAADGYNNTPANIVILRTVFFMFFLQLGFFYRQHLEQRLPYTSTSALCVIGLQALFLMCYHDIAYTVGTMNFYGHPFLPFLVALNGIYFALHIVKFLAPLLTPSHILVRIGQNSFHICALHMSLGFVVLLLARAFYGISEPITDPLYVYGPYRFWAVYVAVGVLGPVFLIEALRRWRDRLTGKQPIGNYLYHRVKQFYG